MSSHSSRSLTVARTGWAVAMTITSLKTSFMTSFSTMTWTGTSLMTSFTTTTSLITSLMTSFSIMTGSAAVPPQATANSSTNINGVRMSTLGFPSQ